MSSYTANSARSREAAEISEGGQNVQIFGYNINNRSSMVTIGKELHTGKLLREILKVLTTRKETFVIMCCDRY